jgi:methyl-accepting chemotaxis protein
MFPKTIKSKFLLNISAAIISIIVSIFVAYFIALSSIQHIMENDLNSVADSLEKSYTYIASTDSKAYEKEAFKKSVKAVKVGFTGYVYMIDDKGTMVVHHKKEGKNYAGKSYIDHIRADKSGGFHNYTSATTGQHKIAAYRYIKEWGLWVVPGVNKADYFDNVKAKFLESFLVIGGFIIGFLLMINFLISKSILNPIFTLNNVSKDLSTGSADLTKRLPIKNSEDEIGIASDHLNNFINRIQDTINETKNITVSAVGSTTTLNHSAEQLTEKSEATSTLASDANSNAQEVTTSLTNSLEQAKVSLKNIEQTDEELDNVLTIISQIAEEINTTSSMGSDLAERFTQLSNETQSINDVLVIISDIADQTNLLALNAAIEAARAGEHGRGFAVVADEVRKLAERTQKSLSEINSTVSLVIQSISDSSDMMHSNSKNISSLAQRSDEIQDKINLASESLQNNVQISRDSLESTQQMVSSVNSITTIISTMQEYSQSNLSEAKQITDISQELYHEATKLNTTLNEFTS